MICDLCKDDCETDEQQEPVEEFFCSVNDHAFGMGGPDNGPGLLPGAGAFSPRHPPSADGFRAMVDFMCVKDPEKNKLCYDIQTEIMQQPGVIVEDAEFDMCTVDCESPQTAALLQMGCCLASFIA